MDRQKNNSTLNKLGDIYQYYIALLECFKMQVGDKIQIEIQGDVTLISDTKSVFQKEVKHHVSNDRLSDRDVDLWNTLKNWVIYYSKSMLFDELILFTTVDILKTSIYYDWNNKTKEEKYSILCEVGKITKEKEIGFRPDYNKIFKDKVTKDELCNLLDKFKIEYLQPQIQGLSSSFSQYITPIPDANKDNYIAALLGMVLAEVKNPPYRWEITYANFQKYAQDITPSYSNKEKIQLPLDFESTEPDSNESKIAKGKIFVKELEKIEHNRIKPNAISDYWKATKTVTRYFSDNISYISSLNSYRKSLKDRMYYTKVIILDNGILTNREQEIKHSKLFCSDVLSWEANDFGSIVGNQSFFKNGIIHNIIDDKEFTWDVGDECES